MQASHGSFRAAKGKGFYAERPPQADTTKAARMAEAATHDFRPISQRAERH